MDKLNDDPTKECENCYNNNCKSPIIATSEFPPDWGIIRESKIVGMNYYKYRQQVSSDECINYISMQEKIRINEIEEDLRNITKA